ncbi:hypothetical protein N0V90_012356 [Kalmusia sp. IMI 367209]|nr:hypothetical protein N0V90_012356 [Kalmusia sp. IMI 367209]
MAASLGAGSDEPDMTLVAELLEQIQRHPPATYEKILLAEHYVSVGWLDAAADYIAELKREAPHSEEVVNLAKLVERQPEPSTSQSEPTVELTGSKSGAPRSVMDSSRQQDIQADGDFSGSRKDLVEGHQGLRQRAKSLFGDLFHLQSFQKKHGLPHSANTPRLQAIIEGRPPGDIVHAKPPGSAQHVARTIQAHPDKSLDLAIADLEEALYWERQPHGQSSSASDDSLRDALVKRKHALSALLPSNLRIHCDLALMHTEHEHLSRTYANSETMVELLPIKTIARENFYVTEDNYAWDMSELAGYIAANGGTMRNPLSKNMFTPADVRGILHHAQGRRLAALQVEQHDLSRGVRPETIAQMENLGNVLLGEEDRDQKRSRHAVDEFLAYVATLPEREQKAIHGLRCPARDSHTGQAFDTTIGEAVRNAKGNLVCFHKTGDFILQAAAHLRQPRAVARESDRGCVVM